MKSSTIKIPKLRWWIAGLLFLASVLNYIDRQTLSLLAPTIQEKLKIDDAGYAFVVNCFLVTYMIGTLASGYLVDRLGVRVSLALFVGWWSISNMLTGFARSLTSLGLFRALLGLGESGNWTAAPKAVGEWFPAKERGLAIGLYTLGATVGATIAPIFIVEWAAAYGWQSVFVVTGGLGLLWLIPWLWLYRAPSGHPYLTDKERAVMEAQVAEEAPSRPESWLQVMKRREVWLLMLARMLTDPVWYFFQFWFAKYLHDERGVGQLGLSVTFVIFLAADFGSLGGGWLSGRFIRRGARPVAARIRVMTYMACLFPLSFLVPGIGPLKLVLVVGMIAAFAHMSWLINLSALVVDVIPKGSLATTFGLIATGSALGGIVMNSAVGHMVKSFSYAPAFMAMGVLHPIALLLLWRFRNRPADAA